MKFIDEVQITVASGRGGPGAVSFRREAMTPRGGPDGGDGGKGGDVILEAHPGLNSLVDFRPRKRYSAQNGEAGAGANCSGANGQDLILKVPPGTLIKSPSGEVLVDMTGLDRYTLLKGGRGGKGNAFFKTSVNQAPDRAQPGEAGEEQEILLELKLLADVGIIGFPNAGKSTLISRMSSAKPKIADYPFTTLTPNLGVVRVADYKSFVMADIPGLIQGAHQGVGLGIQFLRHIERTKVFVHLVDATGNGHRDPLQDYKDINHELEMYDQTNRDKEGFFPLKNRPQIVVLSKIDTVSPEQLKDLEKKFEKEFNIKPMTISAVTGKNIEPLTYKIMEHVFESSAGDKEIK